MLFQRIVLSTNLKKIGKNLISDITITGRNPTLRHFLYVTETQLHVPATFKLCGNVSNQVLAILSSIDTDALNKMAGLVSLWARSK